MYWRFCETCIVAALKNRTDPKIKMRPKGPQVKQDSQTNTFQNLQKRPKVPLAKNPKVKQDSQEQHQIWGPSRK